jgi:hypothetical protein
MKRIFWWTVILLFVSISFVRAETWMVRAPDPSENMLETLWDVRCEAGRVEYFVQSRNSPVYILRADPDETRVELADGMVRRFSPGFLLLTDLPLPVFLPGPDKLMSGHIACFQEYVGETTFRSCVNIILAESPDQARSLPAPQPGSVILVLDGEAPTAVIGPDYQAWRVE